MKVRAIDLPLHHAALQAELLQAFERVSRSGQFVLGAEVADFEAEIAAFVGVRHAVGVSSGTDALLCVLLALGIGPGHEVITTPFTFFATVEAIVRTGAIPRFVDLRSDTLNLDERAVEAAINARTRAIVVVHLFGIPAELPALCAIAERHGLTLVADAAQALGATCRGRRVGGEGRASVFSFHPTKPLGALGDGGLITTDDTALAEACRGLRVHGAVDKHEHRRLGGNFRLDALQAALLRVKLPRLAHWLEARSRHAGAYTDALSEIDGLVVPRVPAGMKSSWSQYTLRIREGRRDALALHLADCGIETAVHYPRPVYEQPALRGVVQVSPGTFPECERAVLEVLSIPVHAELGVGERDHVIASIRRFFR